MNKNAISAEVHTFTVTLLCPTCADILLDPSRGSGFWELTQLKAHDGHIRKCDGCNSWVTIRYKRPIW